MAFAYRLDDRDGRPAFLGGSTAALLICDLSRPDAALIAFDAVERAAFRSQGEVVLLSAAEACADAARRVEPVALDRARTFDVTVVALSDDDARLSTPLLSLLASLRIASVERVGAEGAGDYARPRREPGKRALFIFPGVFLPPRTGAHQRALSTVLDLIDGGYDVDVVIKKNGPKLFARTRRYFDLVASSTRAYEGEAPRAKRSAPFPLRPAPADFDERARTDDNAEGRALVAELMSRTAYDAAVISFPWMTGILSEAPTDGVRIVCDAHDVVSNRLRDLGGLALRLSGKAERMRRREAELLAPCHEVLAISENDKAMFEAKLGLRNVVAHPMTYRALRPAEPRPRRVGSLHFGFLGSDMEANRLALRHVMTRWWPIIEEAAPGSRLTVAGSVARAPAVSPYVLLREHVDVAGFVEDLAGFFDGVDALLSPAIVQAGVNIKNVEGLLRRRIVIANTIGAKSMAPVSLPTVCDDDEAFRAVIAGLAQGDDVLEAAIDKCFDEAQAYFGDPKPLVFA